jgi:cellulose 1,4-beta-cellobiosidase
LLKDENTYESFKLKGKEFTFTVDDSKLDCGLNGALYFVAMDADGGKAKYSSFKPGAKYGMGYCDAQCPHDMKFISGKANVDDWKPQDNDENSGNGKLGTCCSEMDIWEGNSIAQAYTVHACTKSNNTNALELIAETQMQGTDIKELAIKMDVTMLHIDGVRAVSMVRVRLLTPSRR